MSAPQTNVEKQEKDHKPALLGMKASVIFAVVMLIVMIGWLALRGNTPDEAETQIDGRTGDTVVTE